MSVSVILLSLSLVTLSQAQWWQPSSGANANAFGGANALWGSTGVNNRARTFSSPWGASGSVMGNAWGQGVNPNAWNAATSNTWSQGRRKRQTFGFPGLGFPSSSNAGGNSLGGANADMGDAFTNNNARSWSSPWGASGEAFGNAGSRGYRPNSWNAASANSNWQGRR